ncbi:MAG TPA: alpha/beta fold hydrolase [Nocardioides sp.]|jgi:3-oxoadipate enol-lactonase/4-carboxymuconolactone decarboxylase|uniref:bifunctional 3-oxoadipate enol-lactonase/4-carboxymuconolactone decarboxylase PcaDC n=1 Tax=Nocardioides sp. TaxID=35761 RepID=UPI002E33069C|nr:alpha/beta fold hydrolase [Nocardioides sp.]HEX3930778.1 alpha/beta fold hydrolase [Nocardioides sp.]
MTSPEITLVRLGGGADRPLLVVGPSLGTSVTALWGAAAAELEDAFHVVGWELPGHGRGAPARFSFTVAELAGGVLASVRRVLTECGQDSFVVAGDSLGGAVALQVALDAPEQVTGSLVMCTGARIGRPVEWRERAAQVRATGTASLVEPSAERWFAPGFIDRQPARAGALLHSLRDTDAESYALACEALAGLDLGGRLAEMRVPVVAIAGALDEVTPVRDLQEISDGVPCGACVELPGVGHLAAVESPGAVADLIRGLAPGTGEASYVRGLRMRVDVLGREHVGRAASATSDLTRDFQTFITRYAWDGIWNRPKLDRRSRSVGVLTALVCGGHFEELAFHLRAARTNGLTRDEIVEVLLQSAVYAGVPAANRAFAVANEALADDTATGEVDL